MWLDAFPVSAGFTFGGALSLGLAVAAMVLSVVAFVRGVGPQYELKGSRIGLLLILTSILGYLIGTSLQSDILHTLSIAVFYWGSVLYLGGARSLVSSLPSGLILLSSFVPMVYGALGLIYLDGLSWALIVTSGALLWQWRKSMVHPACGLCASFMDRGKSFCSSCGRLIGPLAAPTSRKLLGFAVFTVVMLATLSLTVPLLVATPTVSLANVSLGGPQIGNHFAPLPGWGVKTATFTRNGTSVDEYTFTQGRVTIEAIVATSPDSTIAASAVNSTRVSATPDPSVPASIAQVMPGYTLIQGGTKYVGLEGLFQVGMLNGSTIPNTFVEVDLRQTSASFDADHGSTLYSTAAAVISWATASSQWSPTVQELISAYQDFVQVAYVCSFAGFGVVLFTVARDDELTRTRRLESMQALGGSEVVVLKAFGSSSKPMTGGDLRDSAREIDPLQSDSAFYGSLEEVSRRGLATPSVIIERGRPKLYWRRLV
jgi:hypothetical protein